MLSLGPGWGNPPATLQQQRSTAQHSMACWFAVHIIISTIKSKSASAGCTLTLSPLLQCLLQAPNLASAHSIFRSATTEGLHKMQSPCSSTASAGAYLYVHVWLSLRSQHLALQVRLSYVSGVSRVIHLQ